MLFYYNNAGAVEWLDVGLTTLGKATMSRGMNHFVFVVYSNALATLILLSSSFFINRMEKLNIGSSISQIKVMGTVLSIAGALLVTLYKGSPIISFRTQPSPSQPLPSLLAATSNWVIGGLFFATASISPAAWNITQAAILKGDSSQLTILAYYCLFGTIQSAILSLIVVRDPNEWKIRPDVELIAVFYSATVGSVVTFSVNTWCIKKKGAVFISLFKPVGIAIAAFSTVVFLGETLHVGSVIGAVVIAIGFYTVLWAQSKEENAKGLQVDRLSSPSAQASPLLETVPRK
ncbi:hypothetical protein JHK87_046704 [Glycine soja]|nr:hypothetical protein JHK87_046704 [Glycine soja]